MATPQSLAQAHYLRQQRVTRAATKAVQRLWAEVDVAAIGQSWRALSSRAVEAVATGQLLAAAGAAAYVFAQADLQASAADGLAADPASFAGFTAEGVALEAAMGSVVASTGRSITAGAPPREAVLSGGLRMLNLVSNEVQQAGSNATQVGITAMPSLRGYVRMLQTPSCPRCIILAGRVYKWSRGFQRHPRCDCVHVPYAEAANVQDVRTSPQGYFDSLTAEEQDKIFGKANAQAIRDGADMNQVVNISRRGSLYEFDVADGTRLQATIEGTTLRQGRAGRLLGLPSGPIPEAFERASTARLTPRSIYTLAGDDRDLARSLLSRYGYVRSDWTPNFRRSNRSLLNDLRYQRLMQWW